MTILMNVCKVLFWTTSALLGLTLCAVTGIAFAGVALILLT